MALYLRWLERSAKCNSMQICRRFESCRSHQGKGGIFSLVILIPPIYDHSQVRVTHGKGYPSMCCSAILLSLAPKKTADPVGLLLSALCFRMNKNRRGAKEKDRYRGAVRAREQNGRFFRSDFCPVVLASPKKH